jgi:hypothetical protein
MIRRFTPVAVVAAGVTISACEFGAVGLFDLPAPEEVGVTLTLVAGDDAAAQAVGWVAGAIPGAEVILAAADTASTWSRTLVSDSSGNVQLEGVPAGDYLLQVRRLLDEGERAAVHGVADVVGFVHRGTFGVRPGTATQQLRVSASRRGSLVLSELKMSADEIPGERFPYQRGHYIEIYNNADSTIYLDGKVLAEGFFTWEDYPTQTCAQNRVMRVDPLGIWSGQAMQFPGSGRDHPLAPGRTAVIALDAIDHRAFAPGAPDLSNADFESRGLADVDNPAVPDMIDVGLRSPPAGPQFRPGSTILIADVLDFGSLPRGTTSTSSLQWARVPTEKILDVTMFNSPIPTDLPLCPDLYHPVHHSGPLPFSAEWNLSAHRRPLTNIGGHVVLQNTRSTSADWFIDTPRPGALPPD